MRRYAPAILLLLLAVGLVFGIARLFELRFQTGDVYPSYSSLRSDPLGTMVFYESLEQLPELSVQRDFSTSNRLPNGSDTAYLHLAASMEVWRHIPVKLFTEIDRFVNDGGRLVIAMTPVPAEIIRRLPEKAKKEEPKEPEDDYAPKETSVSDHWGLNYKILNLASDKIAGYQPANVRNVRGLGLPETMAWHSGIVFFDLKPEWNPIFVRGNDAVIVERRFGRGSVVFASDSYFLSNEAMRKDRHSNLLAWLVGPDRIVVFDEAHLGVTETPNLASLLGRYRLRWLIVCLIVLAGLFLWKNTTSLIPVTQEERQPAYVSGKDTREGFVNLLRRTIPARDLLSTCFKEWRNSNARSGKHDDVRRRQAETEFETENSRSAKDRDPVRTYQTISRLLQKRKS
jgi:SAM-dependent methyltransferase